MIIIFFLLNLGIETEIDSLRVLLNERPDLALVLKINKLYCSIGEFDSGINILSESEKILSKEDGPYLVYSIADNYLFAGRILDARAQYLRLVSAYPNSKIANDGLERLLLIEWTRKDTLLLKKLARAIYFIESAQFEYAEDSLKNLLKTNIGPYAYYYLACLYKTKGELPLALSALEELNESYPQHNLSNAILLLAKINLNLGNKKEAQKILEDLIIKEPTSIYAARARTMLKADR